MNAPKTATGPRERLLRGGMVTLGFHPDAPVEVDQLVALVERSKGRCRLSADFQLSFTPANRDWDGLVEEIQTVLQQIQQPRAGSAEGEGFEGPRVQGSKRA